MNTFKKVSSVALMCALLAPAVSFAETSTGTVEANPIKVTYNPSCASATVIAQENSMQSLQDAFQATMKTNSATRRDALAAAFLKTDSTERQAALKAAHDVSQTAEDTARKAMMVSIKTLTDSFKTTMQACGVGMMMNDQKPGDDEHGQMGDKDENGSMMMNQGGDKSMDHSKQDSKDKKSTKKGKGKKSGKKEGAMMQGDKSMMQDTGKSMMPHQTPQGGMMQKPQQ